MKPSRWTDEDEIVIRRLHGKYSNKVLAKILDRSVCAVEMRVSDMRKRGSLAPARAFGGGHGQG